MFSSNQVFEVSCTKGQLKPVLAFALDMANDERNRPRNLVYQTTPDGRFAIGWFHQEPTAGWQTLVSPTPSVDLLTEAAIQYLKDHPDRSIELWDGSYEQGYLVKVIEETMAAEWNGIKNPLYGYVTIQAHKIFYSK